MLDMSSWFSFSFMVGKTGRKMTGSLGQAMTEFDSAALARVEFPGSLGALGRPDHHQPRFKLKQVRKRREMTKWMRVFALCRTWLSVFHVLQGKR